MILETKKLYSGPNYEIRMADNREGLRIEFVGSRIDELRYLLDRATNTLEPKKIPQWVEDFYEMLE